MFSGIVEEVGSVISFDGGTLIVHADKVLEDLQVSESICVAGACLTVTDVTAETFTVETVPETISRTNFKNLRSGAGVNLERSLKYGDRVGGHMVQGHVDAVGEIGVMTPDGNSVRIRVNAPIHIMRYVVEKGFIAVDGISLTVVDCDDQGFSVAVIPYTLAHTTLSERKPGDQINLETDVMAKYVERLAAPYSASSKPSSKM